MNEKHPAPTREDHDDFCANERWTLVRGAAGKPVTHHKTYELTLWDSRILRTRISRPIDRTDYSARMWLHILHNQLEVTHDVFWLCARDGIVPDRGAPKVLRPRKSVPLYLVRELARLGMTEPDILAVDAAGAAQAHAELLAEQPSASHDVDDPG
ncbi:cytotoxic translational repressor of toxin-antitoxin stability system [Microbacterium sp. CH12i]|uniref:cytotoxic translational repressor of toxin-antitoxin stability system n=1 Tax=Microbacterium sp. CH12i TaxID=1479651 RepID=UPI000460D833|nr:cytotoxic translational repressor of toxin-antitoxin stability system [Microbacterium sp. CH12i]KDA06240.1 cytotoxic translational repressor of toxin-antitoxin stability system [Microbacterium sp. CH12i]